VGHSNPELLAERARKLATSIASIATDGLARSRVYLFSGTNDRIVLPSIVAAAAKLYTALGVPDAQVKLVSDIGAGHAFVTEDKGLACGAPASPTSPTATTTRPACCSATSTASCGRARRSRPASSSCSTSANSCAT
jgi:hypothetical protein